MSDIYMSPCVLYIGSSSHPFPIYLLVFRSISDIRGGSDTFEYRSLMTDMDNAHIMSIDATLNIQYHIVILK